MSEIKLDTHTLNFAVDKAKYSLVGLNIRHVENTIENLERSLRDTLPIPYGICGLICDSASSELLILITRKEAKARGFDDGYIDRNSDNVFPIIPPPQYLGEYEVKQCSKFGINEFTRSAQAFIKNKDNLWDSKDTYCNIRRKIAEQLIVELKTVKKMLLEEESCDEDIK